MPAQKNKIATFLLIITICVILLAAVVLCIVAVVSSDMEQNPVATPTPSLPDDDEDSFDPNEIVVREDPVVMTVDLLPVKYSEFCYFYYISAGEVLSNAEDVEQVLADDFQTVIYNMAKEYAAKYVLYRQAYEKENYDVNETYALYLQTNFMMASDREELDAMNANLLRQYGIVRNEYIDILLCNDAIASYRQVLSKEANYTDAELEAFYEEKENLFRKKGIRVILLKGTDEIVATQLKEKIENGYDMKSLVAEYSISTTKGKDEGLWEGNAEDFSSKKIQTFLQTAALGDVAVLTEENAVYVVRYENDGSFALRKDEVSAYKAIYDFDLKLTEKAKNQEMIVMVEETLLKKLGLPAFIEEDTNL